MKSLFEIELSGVGYSYMRAYAWADDEQQARELFLAKYAARKIVSIFLLFNGDAESFVTEPSGDGFEMEKKK